MSWFPITWNLTEIMRFALRKSILFSLSLVGSFYQFKFWSRLCWAVHWICCYFYSSTQTKVLVLPFIIFFLHLVVCPMYTIIISCLNLNHFLQKAYWRVFKTFGTIFSKKLNYQWELVEPQTELSFRETYRPEQLLFTGQGGGLRF